MNGILIKVVIDTNVIFMALYDEKSKAGMVIRAAIEGKIKLYSPDSVKEEISRVLTKELNYSKEDIGKCIDALPIEWIGKEIYSPFLERTKVKHKADKPVEAVALMVNCGILSADAHFKDRININELLEKL